MALGPQNVLRITYYVSAGPFEDWYTNSPSVSPNVQAGMDLWMEKAGKSSEQSACLGCDEGAEAEKTAVAVCHS